MKNNFTIEDAKKVVKAWQKLPQGNLNIEGMANWLIQDMQPVMKMLKEKIEKEEDKKLSQAERIYEKHFGLNQELGYKPVDKESILVAIEEGIDSNRYGLDLKNIQRKFDELLKDELIEENLKDIRDWIAKYRTSR